MFTMEIGFYARPDSSAILFFVLADKTFFYSYKTEIYLGKDYEFYESQVKIVQVII